MRAEGDTIQTARPEAAALSQIVNMLHKIKEALKHGEESQNVAVGPDAVLRVSVVSFECSLRQHIRKPLRTCARSTVEIQIYLFLDVVLDMVPGLFVSNRRWPAGSSAATSRETPVTSKERVLQSFRHRSPDRVPLDYSAAAELNARLMERFQLPDYEALLLKLHVDFRHMDKWGNMVPRYVGPELKRYPDGTCEDYWGLRYRKIEYKPGCFYEELVQPPLANASTVKDVEKHLWPKPEWIDFSAIPDYCKEHNDYCLVGGLGATFDMVGYFRGMEQGMVDIYDNPALVEAIIAKLFEFKYEYNLRMLQAAGGRLDILFVSEDMGSQNGLIVSKETLKRYVFPCLEKFAQLAHKYKAMLMLHSDGAIYDIIPELIELGVDIINPVQPGCPGMDPARLKREFGKQLCFHGLLDTQHLMPYGSPHDIMTEIKKLAAEVGAGGGLALAPSNNFQIDVPLPNIMAVYGMKSS